MRNRPDGFMANTGYSASPPATGNRRTWPKRIGEPDPETAAQGSSRAVTPPAAQRHTATDSSPAVAVDPDFARMITNDEGTHKSRETNRLPGQPRRHPARPARVPHS